MHPKENDRYPYGYGCWFPPPGGGFAQPFLQILVVYFIFLGTFLGMDAYDFKFDIGSPFEATHHNANCILLQIVKGGRYECNLATKGFERILIEIRWILNEIK